VSRARTERGTALVEVTWLSLLLLVPLLYVVLAVFEVQRAAYGVDAASRAAARAYSLAPTEAAGSTRARTAASVALADQGLRLSPGQLVIRCVPAPTSCLSPGSVIHVHVSCPVALPLMPSALGGNTPSIRVESDQAVPYGSFREHRP
jgi:hypothetical protein